MGNVRSLKSGIQALADQDHPRTAQVHYRRVGLMKGAMLMPGLSAENALKGALVFRSKPDVSKGKMNSGIFTKSLMAWLMLQKHWIWI